MKLLKKKTVFVSMFLVFVLCLSFLLPSFAYVNNDLDTRNIDVNEIGTLSYEEKAQQLLNTFDEYSILNDENTISFEGYVDISSFDFSGIQYLSTTADTTIKKYKTDLDIDNEKFYIITEYIQDDVVVYSEKVETTPYYDEYEDDYYISMPDGTNVSLSENLSTENFNECSVTLAALGIALTAKEVAVLLSAVVVVAAPVIVEVVNVVVTTIVSWVRSFWSWFRSLFTKKTTTVVSTTVTTTISYTLTLSYSDTQTKVEAKPFDKTHHYEPSKYYFAIADTTDGLLYVSQVPIDNLYALSILTTSTYIKSAHKNDLDKNGNQKEFVVSLYTPAKIDALYIATEAGTILGSPGAIHHDAPKLGYFNHYHPGLKYSHPHVFYGTPKI